MASPKRISITVDEELITQLIDVKKNLFFDKSYADMYRFLIALGIKQAEKGKK